MSRPEHEHQPDTDTEPEPEPGSETARRRRRAEVFGEALPETTSDERSDTRDERESEAGADEWLRRQVPPHHG